MPPRSKLRIVPLGGLGEVGKNMMAIEYEDDIIIVDAGLMFPEEEMHGIDLVIPDITYLIERKDKVRAIFITHGHEDHIGALPYVLPQLKVPVYSTKLTNGLISLGLKERRGLVNSDLRVVAEHGQVTVGKFRVEFFAVCHSIPDAAGLIIHTPAGVLIHSGDFKLDYSPVGGRPTDLARLAQLGTQGVLLLMADSTYAEMPGYTPSESVVYDTFDRVMATTSGRVIIATFSSLVSRVQQIIDAATKYGRKVFVVGRSMTETSKMALKLGYLHDPQNVLTPLEQLRSVPHNKVVFITTGSQGEPTSALVRMANRDHPQVHILPGDTVILSATAIPGNESLVNRTVNSLFRQGAIVLYDKNAIVHVHGHGSQEELKLLLHLVRPKYFMPIHGEYRHLSFHAKLAEAVGVPKENSFLLEDGDALEIGPQKAEVIRGKVQAGNVYVDGLSVGDIGGIVLRDRKMLAKDGIVMVIVAVNKQTGKLEGLPDITTRGFVDLKEASIIEESRNVVAKAMEHPGNQTLDWSFMNTKIRDTLNKFYYDQTKRHPMILPFIVKV